MMSHGMDQLRVGSNQYSPDGDEMNDGIGLNNRDQGADNFSNAYSLRLALIYIGGVTAGLKKVTVPKESER
jgi:hypothetical protein